MLLGVNGTQKSMLLRGILDDALRKIDGASKHMNFSAQTDIVRDPIKVVALSAVPNDRFPSKQRSMESKFLSRYDVDRYEYIGPRTARNLVSRRQSFFALFDAILNNGEVVAQKAEFFESLSFKTSVPLSFGVALKMRSGSGGVKMFLNELSMQRKSYKRIPDADLQELQERISDLKDLDDRIGNNGVGVYVDLRNGFDTQGIDPRVIQLALRLGYISLGEVTFQNNQYANDDRNNVDRFSAGQWGLFSSLTSLALLATNDTLVLVDEPESALHPSWQREYLDDLMRALEHRNGCHVILATHSPLIVGALGSKDADLIVLKKDPESGRITANLAEIPTGWQTNDVLEDIFDLPSTRAPHLASRLDEALRLIAGGLRANHKKIAQLASELSAMAKLLPEEDSARQIIATIVKLSTTN